MEKARGPCERPDKGEVALRATGLVPDGKVIVIPNQAFDVNGKHFEGSDAWVGIKKQE